MVNLGMLSKDAAKLGHDVVSGAEKVGGYVKHHPVQTAVLAGTTAALAAGAVFTGGADLAAAPEVVGAELGGTAAAEGAGSVGLAAASVGTDAGAAAADAGVGTGVAADAAATGTSEATSAATDSTGLMTKIARGASTAFKPLGKALGTTIRYGLPVAGIGEAVNFGLTEASKGISNLNSQVLGVSSPLPYPNLNPLSPGGALSGGGQSSPSGASQPGSTGLSSLLSSPISKYVILAGGVLIVYALSRSGKL